MSQASWNAASRSGPHMTCTSLAPWIPMLLSSFQLHVVARCALILDVTCQLPTTPSLGFSFLLHHHKSVCPKVCPRLTIIRLELAVDSAATTFRLSWQPSGAVIPCCASSNAVANGWKHSSIVSVSHLRLRQRAQLSSTGFFSPSGSTTATCQSL